MENFSANKLLYYYIISYIFFFLSFIMVHPVQIASHIEPNQTCTQSNRKLVAAFDAAAAAATNNTVNRHSICYAQLSSYSPFVACRASDWRSVRVHFCVSTDHGIDNKNANSKTSGIGAFIIGVFFRTSCSTSQHNNKKLLLTAVRMCICMFLTRLFTLHKCEHICLNAAWNMVLFVCLRIC